MNNTSPLVVWERFFVYGREAPGGSRFKGKVNQESLTGYVEYTSQEDKNEKRNEMNIHEGGYLGYTQKEESTFSSFGWIKDEGKELIPELMDSFNEDGDIWWEMIFSLGSYETASKYGLDNVEDYQKIISASMLEIFERLNFNASNMVWWANYHKDTSHPHVHINFMEKNKTRIRGKLKPKELEKVKQVFIKKLLNNEKMNDARKEFENKLFKEKDIHRKNIIRQISSRDVLFNSDKVQRLFSMLPDKGRLQYNSTNMKPYRKQLDSIVNDILNEPEVKIEFDKYMDVVMKLKGNVDRMINGDVGTIRDRELEKLKSQIGNEILKYYKEKWTIVNNKASILHYTLRKTDVIGTEKTLLIELDDNSFIEINNNKKYWNRKKTKYYGAFRKNKLYRIITSDGKIVGQIKGDDLYKKMLDKYPHIVKDTSNKNTMKSVRRVPMTYSNLKQSVRLRVGSNRSEKEKELEEWRKANGLA